MRALVLEHLRSNPVGLYGDLLGERDIAFDRALLDAGDPLPDWRGYDLLVVMGGGVSAYQEDEYPWLAGEKTAIREAVHSGLPYFGVCLGSQLLASALGARVYRGAAPELGVNPVLLTEAARRDPVFRGFPSDVEAFEWHSDTFELPQGAVLLARSPRYENQAYRVGRVAYAIQCHLEPTLEDVATGLLPGHRCSTRSRNATASGPSTASSPTTRRRSRSCTAQPGSSSPAGSSTASLPAASRCATAAGAPRRPTSCSAGRQSALASGGCLPMRARDEAGFSFCAGPQG